MSSASVSEKFRNPLIVLIDEVIAHMREKVTFTDEEKIEIFDRIKPTVPPE